MTERTGSAHEGEAARWATVAVFFCLGLLMAAWFTQIPEFKARLHLTEAELGAALLCPAAGSLVSMQGAGRLARRFGGSAVLRVDLLCLAASLPLLGSARGPVLFGVALSVLGLFDGILDVTMNAHAVAVERTLGRPVLQGMHGAYSLGSIVGAASGGLAIWAGWSPLAYLSVVAVVVAVTSLATGPRLLPAATDRETPGAGTEDAVRHGPRSGWSAGWSPFVVLMGLLGAGCLLAGGAAESWGAVFLRTERHSGATLASAGYLAFTAAQLLGRFAGDRLHTRWGSATLVRRGALLSAAGLVVALVPAHPVVAVAGLGVYGLGLSVLVPIVFGSVGHTSAEERGSASVTAAVARFTTLSYLGYLLGPAVIGWMAQGIGLTWSLASVLLVLGAVVACAPKVRGAIPDAEGAGFEGVGSGGVGAEGAAGSGGVGSEGAGSGGVGSGGPRADTASDVDADSGSADTPSGTADTASGTAV